MARFSNLFTGEMPQPPSGDKAIVDKAADYHILLVDDEAGVLNALRRVFRRENYQIHVAMSGEEALALLEQQPCQLMISDFMMPRMNGVQLLRKVREEYPDLMRIMLTGHADTEAVMGAIKDGAVYKFILKPWNDDDLRITVALALEQYDLIRKNAALKQQNEKDAKEINELAKLTVTNRSQLAIMLYKRNLLNDQQIQQLYKLQQQRRYHPAARPEFAAGAVDGHQRLSRHGLSQAHGAFPPTVRHGARDDLPRRVELSDAPVL